MRRVQSGSSGRGHAMRGSSSDVDDANLFLDIDEQERLVQSFEDANARATNTWRACFSVLTLGLSGFYAYSAYIQHYHPWQRSYYNEFQGLMPSSFVVSADIATTTVFLLLLVSLLGFSRSRLLLGAALTSSLLCLFWIHYILMLPRPAVKRVFWLPFTTLVYVGAVYYVESTLKRSALDIAGLRSTMYNHKQL